MKREPRIILYENGENKGAFYTKKHPPKYIYLLNYSFI